MTGRDLDNGERLEILRRDILPLYFPTTSASETPILILLGGQPGAGRSRSTGPLLVEHAGDLTILNSDDLRAFHPHFAELAADGSPDAMQSLAQATAAWVQGCIRHARENRRSLLLEGTFQNPSNVAGTAERFTAAGFQTRLVVVASGRAESLLSVVSTYLREVQANVPARYTSREAHDRGFEGTRALVAAFEEPASLDRLTVLGRDGRSVFDARRTDDGEPFRGAGAALAAAQSAPMGRFDATQWLSELHHVTVFAGSRRDLPRGVSESLVDLHELSLREVIPQLEVPAGGTFTTVMEQKTAATLVALRRSLQPQRVVDAAAPVLVPGGPDRGGVSR